MISVNSLQILLFPVGLILAAHYYLEYMVDIEHLLTIPTNQSFPSELTGQWAPNDRLSSAELLYNADLAGVESVVEYKDKLYGADLQNRVFELNTANRKLRYLTTASGRVLGVRIDSTGRLFYLQTNKGIYAVSTLQKDAKPQIVYEHDAQSEVGNERNVTFLDDFDFIERENGQHLFYISQSSVRWTLDELTSLLLENENSGRVLEYDAQTKKLSVLADKMHFPNGIELLPDQSAILVSEFNMRRVARIELNAAKRGQRKYVLENLPGEPDNIRRSKSNTFFVALTSARTTANCDLLDRYAYSVLIRQMFLYLHRTVQVTLDRVISRFTEVEKYQQRWLKYITNMKLKYMKRGAAIEIDADGRIINVFLSESGKVSLLSQVSELKSDKSGKRLLFLGSFVDQPPYKLYV